MVRRFIWSACALAVLLFVCLEVNWKYVSLTLTPSINRITAAAARLHFIALHTATLHHWQPPIVSARPTPHQAALRLGC